jgi:hypothetical protein
MMLSPTHSCHFVKGQSSLHHDLPSVTFFKSHPVTDRRYWNDAIHSWFCSIINAWATNLAHNFSSINFATLLQTWHISWWKDGQTWHHQSRPPYLQWNELNNGKLWRQSTLLQYAFGIIYSISRALVQVFMQNIITVMLHKTFTPTHHSFKM